MKKGRGFCARGLPECVVQAGAPASGGESLPRYSDYRRILDPDAIGVKIFRLDGHPCIQVRNP